MASGMDENRLLAEIERLLAREDPGLEARMSELARRLPGDPADPAAAPPGDRDREGGECGRRRDRRRVLTLAAVVIALVGLVLTAILTQPSGPGAGTTPGSPAGLPAAAAPRS